MFLAMLLFLEIGRQLGIRAFERYGEASRSGVGTVDGAVYGLLSLLIGFTFSGAATRFMARQELIVQEANAVKSAWQRLEALPEQSRAPIRARLLDFTDALIVSHRRAPGSAQEARDRAEVERIARDVWSLAMTTTLAAEGEKARMLVLPSLSDLFSLEEKERHARLTHPPTVIFAMIGVMALAAALFAGYSMSESTPRNWLHIIGVAAAIAVANYVIIELEFPHRGLIRIDAVERTLVDTRADMR